MKKYFIVIFIVLGLGVLSWAQASKDLFDARKSESELEIMKGILRTTLSYAEQNQQNKAVQFGTPYLSAYYLVGQGATFVIPTSSLRRTDLTPFLNGQNIKLALDLSRVKEQSQQMALEARQQAAEIKWATQALMKTYAAEPDSGIGPGIGSGKGSGVGSGTGSGKGSGTKVPPIPPAPPAQPAPPTPPAPPAPPQTDSQDVFKKMEVYQAVLKKSREEAATDQQKFLESLKRLREPLIEALANYGDSLTQVKPGEYINLILSREDSLDIMDYGSAKTRHDIISAQKSWITDYKAGRISLDTFKQKVLQYTE
jgi:hypothetical protein